MRRDDARSERGRSRAKLCRPPAPLLAVAPPSAPQGRGQAQGRVAGPRAPPGGRRVAPVVDGGGPSPQHCGEHQRQHGKAPAWHGTAPAAFSCCMGQMHRTAWQHSPCAGSGCMHVCTCARACTCASLPNRLLLPLGLMGPLNDEPLTLGLAWPPAAAGGVASWTACAHCGGAVALRSTLLEGPGRGPRYCSLRPLRIQHVMCTPHGVHNAVPAAMVALSCI